MKPILRKKDFCKFLGNSVVLKTGYRKRIGAPKLVTGKELGLQNRLQEKNWGSKIGYRKRKGASNMVTEINWGLKYGYGNKLGLQIWLRKQIGASKMVTEKIPLPPMAVLAPVSAHAGPSVNLLSALAEIVIGIVLELHGIALQRLQNCIVFYCQQKIYQNLKGPYPPKYVI